MKKLFALFISLFIALSYNVYAGDDSSKEIENTQVLDAGTYNVTAHRVDPEEKEVYVKTDDDKIVELYFKDDTKLMKDGKKVEFSELKKGQKLTVKLEKDGDHNKPLEVQIME